MASKRVFKGGSAASALFSGQEGNEEKAVFPFRKVGESFSLPLPHWVSWDQCWDQFIPLSHSEFLSCLRLTSPSHVLIASSFPRISGQNAWDSSEWCLEGVTRSFTLLGRDWVKDTAWTHISQSEPLTPPRHQTAPWPLPEASINSFSLP